MGGNPYLRHPVRPVACGNDCHLQAEQAT